MFNQTQTPTPTEKIITAATRAIDRTERATAARNRQQRQDNATAAALIDAAQDTPTAAAALNRAAARIERRKGATANV